MCKVCCVLTWQPHFKTVMHFVRLFSLLLLPCSFVLSADYLINTDNCQVKQYPLFDEEITSLYRKERPSPRCSNSVPPLRIERFKQTWIRIPDLLEQKWKCWAWEVSRDPVTDSLKYGSKGRRLKKLTNFANKHPANVSLDALEKWDAVEVVCLGSRDFRTVIPLVQHYESSLKHLARGKVNVFLFGIDSVSRLNFERQFTVTKEFLERKGFVPLLGHHKVGENSFPNLFAMMTGMRADDHFNDTYYTDLPFDDFPLVINDFKRMGYVTSFTEDMPHYGLFTYGRAGFRGQPTHYYSRPFNLAIRRYLKGQCYHDQTENEVW